MFAIGGVLVAALSVGFGGCGGRASSAVPEAPSKPLPPVDENLLALAPVAYTQVARIDVAALRASRLWGAADLAMSDPTFAAFRSAAKPDPLPSVDEILITGGDPEGSGAEELLVIAKGKIDAKSLEASMNASKPSMDGDAAGGAVPLVAAALTERTLALGTGRIVAEAQALSRREGVSMLSNPNLADLALAPGTAAVWRFRKDREALALERLRLATIRNLKWGGRAVSGDGALRLSDGADIDIAFALDDAEIAAKARRDLSRSFSRLSSNTIVRLLGIKSLLERIRVSGEAERVEVRAALTAEDVGQVAGIFDRIAQIRELLSADSQEDEGPVELEKPVLERGGNP